MQKVLIISYFFPPCNLPASNRANGWAKYLNEFGYYPIIITRSWNREIKHSKDVLKKSGENIAVDKNEKHEIHHLPYLPTLRDQLLQKEGFISGLFTKILTFTELLLQNYTVRILGHANIYSYSENIIQKEGIKKVIVTANPFNLFHFGYKLNKKLNVKWIADYRDDWTTSELADNNNSLLFKLIKYLDTISEKKWVNSASFITSVSGYYTNKISDFVGVSGKTIYNGFYELENDSKNLESSKVFQITYNGTLYATQKIEIFIEAIIDFIDENTTPNIIINFPGLAFSEPQNKRIQNLIKGYQPYFNITNRLPKSEVIEIQKRSHVLLMVAHTNIKGIPSSKIYEYISLQKPILLVPSDKDILENIVNKSGLGMVSNSIEETKNILSKMYENFINHQPISKNIDRDKLTIFSRKNSTKKLAQLLNSL